MSDQDSKSDVRKFLESAEPEQPEQPEQHCKAHKVVHHVEPLQFPSAARAAAAYANAAASESEEGRPIFVPVAFWARVVRGSADGETREAAVEAMVFDCHCGSYVPARDYAAVGLGAFLGVAQTEGDRYRIEEEHAIEVTRVRNEEREAEVAEILAEARERYWLDIALHEARAWQRIFGWDAFGRLGRYASRPYTSARREELRGFFNFLRLQHSYSGSAKEIR